MLRRLLLAALLLSPALAHAEEKGEIDWSRRVIKARGQGAPDLSAPTITVARLGAERAAKADALRNLLETLKGATLESGTSVGTLLQKDSALMVKVRGILRGYRVPPGEPGKANPKYYSDGGVALEVELPIDTLPEELRAGLKAPPGVAPAGEGAPPSATSAPAKRGFFIIDASGMPRPSEGPRLAEEGVGVLSIVAGETVGTLAEARSRMPKGTPILRAVSVDAGNIVITSEDAARLKAAEGVSVILVIQ